MTEIKFCENNYSHGTDEIVERLQLEYDDLDIQVESCLGYCGDCAMGPFALVNDVFIQSDTPEDLYDKIITIL